MKKGSLDKDADRDAPERRIGSIREKPVSVVSILSDQNRELFSDPQVAEALDNIIEQNQPPETSSCGAPILRRIIAGIKARMAARFHSHASHRKPSTETADDAGEKNDTCSLP